MSGAIAGADSEGDAPTVDRENGFASQGSSPRATARYEALLIRDAQAETTAGKEGRVTGSGMRARQRVSRAGENSTAVLAVSMRPRRSARGTR